MMKLYVWLCFMILGWQQLSAQDSLLLHAASYLGSVSNYAAIFSGNRQQPLTFPTTNHQYFKKQDYVTGRLSYAGIVYPGVSLRWDLYRDELVILSPSNFNIVLKSENIDFAEIHGYRMFYLHPDTLVGCPSAGNYILLYSGDYRLLEKLTNNLFKDENSQRNRYIYYFSLSTKFYLQKDGSYYRIKNQRTLLKTLGTHRRELRRFIRANDLSYKHGAEEMVLKVVKEHEKLSRL